MIQLSFQLKTIDVQSRAMKRQNLATSSRIAGNKALIERYRRMLNNLK